jgi:soluble lytic murein transglycosylase-like protein
MATGRRSGGAPRWVRAYAVAYTAALLFTLTVIYLTTVHVRTAVAQFSRHGAEARVIHGVPYAELINRIAIAHELSPALVAAIVVAESGFDARAHSRRGAYGLMQVLPATWREIGIRSSCAPEVAQMTIPPCMDDAAANLEVGATYLRRLVGEFGDNVVLAVAAYNAGARTVTHHGGVPPYPETTRYLRQVALAWFHLDQEGTLSRFWLTVIRSFDVWQHFRVYLLILLALLALPWLWPLPRRSLLPAAPQ